MTPDWVCSIPLIRMVPLPVSSSSSGKVSGTVVVSVVLLVAATGIQNAKVNAAISTNNIDLEKIFDLVFMFLFYLATTSAVKVIVAVYSPASALPQSLLLTATDIWSKNFPELCGVCSLPAEVP